MGYFYRIGKDVLSASSFVHPETGECIKLSLAEKMVYSILREECISFKQSGIPCFLSQGTIAERSGVSRMSVNVALKKLEEFGVIHSVPHKLPNGKYTKEYVWKHDLKVYGKVVVKERIREYDLDELSLDELPF